MKYLLDTCVISDFIKGEPNTLSHIKKTSPMDITISSITVMEICYGLAINQQRAAVIKPVINSFLSKVKILKFSQEDAEETGVIRAQLKKQGNQIGSYDILLAGTALNRQLILVSANIKEFSRIQKLPLENWRT